MNSRYEETQKILNKYNQSQLLTNYNKMNEEEKKILLNQIESIDFDFINDLYNKQDKEKDFSNEKIEPIGFVDKSKLSNEEYKLLDSIGKEKIKDGKLAIVTMAGGQGTRLDHFGPKGTFELNLKKKISLFEIFINMLKKAKQEYGIYINWYIMTSNENNKETIDFFEKNNFFYYPKEKIKFFIQGELPMVSLEGKILLNEEGFVKFASNGHGGVLEAMDKSGILEEMKNNGIEWIYIGGVDNILAKMVDSVFIGLAESRNCLSAGKSIIKARPDEKVGVFCTRNGKTSVIEYSEISEELANKRDEDGNLVFSESHILCNLFNIKQLEKISRSKLQYHIAKKTANYMDENGNIVIADKPNSYKFETFIFDAFTELDSMVIMRVKREEEFAPIKNKEGVDSPETATKLYKDYYKI